MLMKLTPGLPLIHGKLRVRLTYYRVFDLNLLKTKQDDIFGITFVTRNILMANGVETKSDLSLKIKPTNVLSQYLISSELKKTIQSSIVVIVSLMTSYR